MKKIVVKFGGSNLKTKSDIQNVLRAVRSYNNPLVIVVSAFFGITDFIIDNLNDVKKDKSKVQEIINSIYKLKVDALNENIDNDGARDKTLDDIKECLNELEKLLMGIFLISEIPEASEDLVLSYGERLSAITISGILNYYGYTNELILPEDIGLYSDGEFRNATIDYDKSEKPIFDKLNNNNSYVMPGFYGISDEGKVTLLGRGGTDYSASSIARCVKAESLDVWKDVNGFSSADPKLIKNPVSINFLTYQEAAELAYFGAKILHPRTIEPLIEKHIPVRIFNIEEDNKNLNPFTIINSEETIREGIIKSVTSSDDISILKLKGPGVGYKPGILAKVTSKLDKEGINIKSVITSQIAINILLSKNDLIKAHDIIVNLGISVINEIVTIDGISIIAVVGHGILDNYGIASRIFNAVAKKSINVKLSSLGASQVVTYLIVDKKDRDSSIKEIHKEFFEN